MRIFFPAMLASALLSFVVPAKAQVEFEDVTIGSGVEYEGESYGASWGYANDDPLPDLFVSHHRNKPGLYINLGNGTFENREYEIDAWQLTPRSDIHGGTFADYNNDGFDDLMITAGSKNYTQFLVNDGQRFSDRIQDFTFDIKSWGGRLPVWFDFTNDGNLDLAVAVQAAKFQLFERSGSDFVRRNFLSGHECVDQDYAHLSDWTFDGQMDLLCVTHTWGPDRIYDYSVGMPFLDQTSLAVPVNAVNDSIVADFDGDQIMDLFAVRGKVRINGAAIVGDKTVEAHLVNVKLTDSGVTFKSGGDLEVELHWNAPNVNTIYIGAGGVHPTAGEPREPIRFTMRAADTSVHGIKAYDSTIDKGLYIGYDPTTQTWSFFNSAGPTQSSYTYSYIRSTGTISDLDVIGLSHIEKPAKPAMLKYTNGEFSNQIAGTGLDHRVQCNAVAAADFDNDMDVDLYYVCRGGVENFANRLYLNDGTGVFSSASAPHGAEGPVGPGKGLGENVVAGDYDVDGFVDLFVTNGLKLYPFLPGYETGGPDKLFRNTGNSNKWIQIDLTGVVSNRNGIGATVTVTAGGKTQRREQNGGYHRWAQHDQRLHFGLGSNSNADITVYWPSGEIDTYLGVPANRVYEATEGSQVIEPVTIPDSTTGSGCSPAARKPAYDNSDARAMYLWKDNCSSPNWKFRVTGGTAADFNFLGDIQSDLPFISVVGAKLESRDVVDNSDPNRIYYDLLVGSARQDGINFTVDPAANTCFGATSSIKTAYVGENRTPVSVPFDLETLEACGGASEPVEIKLTNWLSPKGGVSVTGNSVTYSGAPAGWALNSVNSVLLSSLGVTSNYSLRWTIGSNPASTTWVVGLGVAETTANWRDVDFGMRSSAGRLTVYENGAWRTSSGNLVAGDVLEIYVGTNQLEYRINGTTIYSRPIEGTESFYVDSSFKNGFIELDNFVLVTY